MNIKQAADKDALDGLAQVNFDDPKVIEAIRERMENFDIEEYREYLEKFQTVPNIGWLEYVD